MLLGLRKYLDFLVDADKEEIYTYFNENFGNVLEIEGELEFSRGKWKDKHFSVGGGGEYLVFDMYGVKHLASFLESLEEDFGKGKVEYIYKAN